jgi:hypothetical protein
MFTKEILKKLAASDRFHDLEAVSSAQKRKTFLLRKAQPKNALVTTTPNSETNKKFHDSVYVHNRVRGTHNVTFFYNVTILQYARTIVHFLQFYNFITFKLRSTTEQMPALFIMYTKLVPKTRQ